MARIAGVDIPDRKKVYYALQYVHGIGPKYAADILAEAQINPDTKANELTESDISNINGIIDTNYLVEGALRRNTAQNIQRLLRANLYRS